MICLENSYKEVLLKFNFWPPLKIACIHNLTIFVIKTCFWNF